MKKFWSNLYLILVNLFFFIPVLAVILGSFNGNKSNTSWEGWTLQWYVDLLNDASLLESLKNTLLLAVISMVLATVIGTLAAVGMYRYHFKGKTAIDALYYLPVVIPEVVLGISLMTLFSLAKLPSGILTLVLAHTTFCIPYVVFNVKASIAGFDPALEEAGMDLGATSGRTLRDITLPLIMPGVFSGAYLAFTLSIDDVIVSCFTNGPGYITLPIKVWGMTKRGIDPDVYALSAIIMVVVLAVLLLSQIKVKKLFLKDGRS